MSYFSFIVSVCDFATDADQRLKHRRELKKQNRQECRKLCLCGLGQKDVGHFENLQW